MNRIPFAQRYDMLRDLVEDDSKTVRMAVARQLTGFPADQLPSASAAKLKSLWKEYMGSMNLNADMPEGQMNLGLFCSSTGDPVAAEKAYRTALELSQQSTPALLNLAGLYRTNGMDSQAEPLLRKAIALAPSEAPPYHAMGLLQVRLGKLDAAIPFLHNASTMDRRIPATVMSMQLPCGRPEKKVSQCRNWSPV